MQYNSTVNGFSVEGFFDDEDVKNIFIPLLEKIIHMQQTKNERLLVFISAPPAVGKSTLVNFLVYLAQTNLNFHDIQTIGIDAFHFYNDYLAENGLASRKGAIDTYDIDKLTNKVASLKKEPHVYFPVYDRNLHEPVQDSILINSKIVLLEGNYLSSTSEKWKNLNKYCDFSIFITAKEEFLKDRLVSRKMKGGKTEKEALTFYENSDSVNIKYVLSNHNKTDVVLELNDYRYTIK